MWIWYHIVLNSLTVISLEIYLIFLGFTSQLLSLNTKHQTVVFKYLKNIGAQHLNGNEVWAGTSLRWGIQKHLGKSKMLYYSFSFQALCILGYTNFQNYIRNERLKKIFENPNQTYFGNLKSGRDLTTWVLTTTAPQ